MSKGNHDTLVYRLAQMLYKLNQGESLDPFALADEFGVNIRTIQRDLNERFAYLPLNKVEGRYQLDQTFLGKLNLRDIERFSGLAGIRGLFPSLSDDFLRDIFDIRMQSALLVKGHNYENISGKEGLFRALEKAIVAHCCIAFDYLRGDERKPYTAIEPYKLLNNKGIWYLAASDGGKLKTFSFSQIRHLHVDNHQFQPDPQIDQRLTEEDGIWFTEEKKEIVLNISREVAGYFKRRKLIANQVLEKELEDGGLIVSAKVGHQNQILPIVRYWIPHIRIISPEGLQAELESELASYLNR
ncbi:WYL domain-containing protein [Pseudomonas sp. SA3-5]|uniref:WYL domain-containing protein n=1 Tax=Pseudomonas aestuarii TaxID=3018340 RepID=A0ABT4XLH7_9PSED|nr:WYL domain-containing protein [Pseudomonas aestuarii]MDA7089074.1 WYL domain-containing protein [Pseudomonas aestuarii]